MRLRLLDNKRPNGLEVPKVWPERQYQSHGQNFLLTRARVSYVDAPMLTSDPVLAFLNKVMATNKVLIELLNAFGSIHLNVAEQISSVVINRVKIFYKVIHRNTSRDKREHIFL